MDEKKYIEIDLTKLDRSEISYICELITPQIIRQFFKKESRFFNRIKPGYRASNLSDKEAIKLLCSNATDGVAANLIIGFLNSKLAEINEYCADLEKQGYPHEKAKMITLSKSLFLDRVGLYFKICGEEYSEEYIALAEEMVAFFKSYDENNDEPSKNAPDSEELTKLRQEVSELTQLNEELQQTIHEKNSEYLQGQQTIQELTDKFDVLNDEFLTVQSLKTELIEKNAALQAEVDRLNSLYRLHDEERKDIFSSEYKHHSICKVYYDWNKNRWLSRIADIHDGRISIFEKDDSLPHYFDNRDKLYWKDGPEEEGAIGVWQWNAVENKTTPGKDYVTTTYVQNASFIEVIEFSDCHSYEDLASALISKEIPSNVAEKVFVVCRDADGQLIGLLIRKRDLTINSGSAKLKSKVFTLPGYELSSADIIPIGERKIYSFTAAGMPNRIIQIRNPIAVAKEIILSRATLSALRNLGLTKREAQNCQAFLKDLPVQTIYDDLSDAYSCSSDEAQQYVSEFIVRADSYLTETDLDTTTLAAAVERSSALQERCKKILTEEWQQENAEKLSAAQSELENIQTQLTEKTESIQRSEEELRVLEQKKAGIQEDIDHQIAFAEEVKANVQKHITDARQNASQFISDMAFISPVMSTPSVATNDNKVLFSRILIGEQGEEITDRDDFAEALGENLEAIGYEENVAIDMAETILFCIENGLPVVCGTNASNISDCVAAMFGNAVHHAFLRLNQDNCQQLCDEIVAASQKHISVVLINGAFDGLSFNFFNELLLRLSPYKDRVVLLFSLNDIPCRMIPKTVWNRTMFIDGDDGFTGFSTQLIQIHQSEPMVNQPITQDAFKSARKLLRPFEKIIDNQALAHYAAFMALNDCGIKDKTIMWQILLHALNLGSKDQITEFLDSAGIEESDCKGFMRYV